ncbi:ATP synthase F1 subunit delta [Candidatus Legionella polyplacis]|uniref:ATP synthase subunit delta n=1 Tax=Candidatus Legionella polyplacis TaxID=2005262 RepID=A0ABZ2GW83_9GAMM|nr:ATP synthase F1 subunit delta [Candidatus Legionella polyplacis]ATW01891.1 ATP synthase F1 subunit delta [Candidatus Legionella polyplacis]
MIIFNKNLRKIYVETIFAYSIKNRTVVGWLNILKFFAKIVLNTEVVSLVKKYNLTVNQQKNLLMLDMFNDFKDKNILEKFLDVLIGNGHFLFLFEIYRDFSFTYYETKNITIVHVVTFLKLSISYKKKLINVLNKKLNSEIKLELLIDKSILGGVILIIGDLVIDNSIKRKLEKLKVNLTG